MRLLTSFFTFIIMGSCRVKYRNTYSRRCEIVNCLLRLFLSVIIIQERSRNLVDTAGIEMKNFSKTRYKFKAVFHSQLFGFPYS